MQGASSILQFLQGTQNPAMELLKMVLPQMGTKTKAMSIAGGGGI
jgi:hypothetical protein